ncbi:MAG: DUF4860 domain-containing protein [Oscillospiraceae bacterium]|nr:DUF4860 domain-containing protein [Oscillospiraceae bacterium]
MKTNEVKGKTDTLMLLLLFSVFALCILAVLLTGTDAYRRLAVRDAASYDARTAEQYLVMRVRQSDVWGDLRVEEFNGVDALVFFETINGKHYKTRVYCFDGYLRELFTAAEEDFLPEDGEEILPAEALSFTLKGQTLTAELIDSDGNCREIALQLRSGRRVA